MKNSILSKNKDWSSWLFWGIVLSYMRLYAPYGINETDGGFITAYAWRLLNGEMLYQDIIYVRPPLSILLRYVEMWLLPEAYELIGERIFFYLKVAVYSLLGASILQKGSEKWMLASIGFIVSVHCYPAAAWHTVDGILFATMAFYFLFNRNVGIFPAALCVFLSMLCKQSFYPMLPLFLLLVGLEKGGRTLAWASASLLLLVLAFYGSLNSLGIWADYQKWTTGSTGMNAAIQSGIWDYTKINTKLLFLLPLLLPLFFDRKIGFPKKYYWYVFLIALMGTYLWSVYQKQSFTVPVGQSRLLFLIGLAYVLLQLYRLVPWQMSLGDWRSEGPPLWRLTALLALAWMAGLSWGYSFPILFATPYIYVLFQITKEVEWGTNRSWAYPLRMALFLSLLIIFRYAYEFVYRDGRRSAMNQKMEQVFPKLNGIYSDRETFDKYLNLKQLHDKYGPHFKTLPAFPLSNYLSNTQSPFPLDWVIRPETNGRQEQLYTIIDQSNFYFFIEKAYGEQLKKNPKFELSSYVMERLTQIDETPYFYVYQKK